jgi:tRNA1Val (adenine37-N6)-methyltransferase
MKKCLADASEPQEDETLDSLFQGRLKILQPRRGYRFSLDSVLLAGLTRVRKKDRVVDLGCGCGIIPLLLAFRQAVSHITGIEIQQSLAAMARRNVEINALSHLIDIVHGDLKNVDRHKLSGPATLVISNPPYRELHSGRSNPESERALARHEILVNVADLVRTAARILPQKGRLALIYPARRLPHLFKEVNQGGFAPKQLTLIHATLDSPAKLAHLESVKGGGEELRVGRPFAIYETDGTYSSGMAAMYEQTPLVS